MHERRAIRRLRSAGAIGAGVILVVLIVQVAVLAMLSFTAQSGTQSINESGLRRTGTLQVLYDKTVHDRAAFERDVVALEGLQANFNDLSPDEASLFARYLADPTPADEGALLATFNRLTDQYGREIDTSRARFRIAALASALIAIALIVAAYLLLVRPVEDRWEELLKNLEERRERFAAIFTESPDPMALYRRDGTIERGNAAAIRMLGLHAEAANAHWSIHVAESQRTIVWAAFERALKGASSEFETIFRTSAGAELPVLCSLSPISVGGKVVGVVGIAKDLSAIRASEAELERSRDRFASMFDFHPDAIAVIDANGHIVRSNVELERLSAYRTEELIGMPLGMLATAQDALEHSGLARALYAEHPLRLDAALRTRNGTSVMVRVDTVPMRAGGFLEGTYVIARDVTRERDLEFRERVQRERLRSLAHLASEYAGSVERQINELLSFAAQSLELDGAMVTRVREDKVYVMYSFGIGHPVGRDAPFSATFTRHIFGTNKVFSFTEAHKSQWAQDPAQQREAWSAVIVTTAYADGEPIGGVLLFSQRPRGKDFNDADRDFVRVVAAMIGASLERERREEELEAIAYADPLTRLPNRRYVLEHLHGAIAKAARSGERVVVYYVDLDGFKAVNDAFGHAAGDAFLNLIATRLRTVVREGDVLARVGGDEFLVIQVTPPDDRNELDLAKRMIETASEPATFNERTVSMGASVGIVVAPANAATAEEAIERADYAMYRSKRAGKGRATLYVQEGGEYCPPHAVSP
ncbi:MAG TPA: diguanylate cyclase [Candidatus Aquilonibacter sp.]